MKLFFQFSIQFLHVQVKTFNQKVKITKSFICNKIPCPGGKTHSPNGETCGAVRTFAQAQKRNHEATGIQFHFASWFLLMTLLCDRHPVSEKQDFAILLFRLDYLLLTLLLLLASGDILEHQATLPDGPAHA